MFNLFDRKTAKDFMKEARETYGVHEATPMSTSIPGSTELYRVGVDGEGNTTLTLIDSSITMTLTMPQAGCERLIRMLRATYETKDEGK